MLTRAKQPLLNVPVHSAPNLYQAAGISLCWIFGENRSILLRHFSYFDGRRRRLCFRLRLGLTTRQNAGADKKNCENCEGNLEFVRTWELHLIMTDQSVRFYREASRNHKEREKIHSFN
jgi:hypothetical protein